MYVLFRLNRVNSKRISLTVVENCSVTQTCHISIVSFVVSSENALLWRSSANTNEGSFSVIVMYSNLHVFH